MRWVFATVETAEQVIVMSSTAEMSKSFADNLSCAQRVTKPSRELLFLGSINAVSV